jgi:cell division protein FtsB
MPATCGVCNEVISGGKASEVISCSGNCKKSFHVNCVKDDINEKNRAVKQWRCKDCRENSVGSVSSTPVTKEFIMKVLDGFKTDVFKEFKTFKTEIEEITRSIGFLSDKVDSSNALMEDMKKQFMSLKKENEELRVKNSALCASVTDLQSRVRSLEQYTRRSNIEISGIPETPKEDVIKLVKDVGAVIGVSVEESQINAAHRVPSFRSDRAPSLVVQFNTRAVRDHWLKQFKENRGTATSDKVNSSFPRTKMFINEHLSPINKLFLAKIKKKCRDIGYAYVWSREGKFFVRRANGEKCIRIDNEADIEKLK